MFRPGPQSAFMQTLLSLKARNLRSLAASLGLPHSGPKPQLVSRILDSIHIKDGSQSPPEPTSKMPQRILSIDMGVRNLAFCLIEAPSSTSVEQEQEQGLSKLLLPKVMAWKLLHVVRKSEVTERQNPTEAKRKPEEPSEEPLEEPSEEPPEETSKETSEELPKWEHDSQQKSPTRKRKRIAESFEPAVWAIRANAISRQFLDEFSPIHTILIERQRYRSNGAAAIQEWTVRVNMFEAMLHAVLRCLSEQGVWRGNVRSISPAMVNSFWLEQAMEATAEEFKRKRVEKEMRKEPRHSREGQLAEDAEQLSTRKGRGRTRKVEQVLLEDDVGNCFGGNKFGKEVLVPKNMGMKSKNAGKVAKTKLVTSWLRRGDVILLDGPNATEIASYFIPPDTPRRRTVSKDKLKLDDLADCLLQGMAWMRWEENRRKLRLKSLTEESAGK